MPEWLGHVLTGMLSAGFLAAAAAAYVKMFGARHGWRRQDRHDEIDVLQESIKTLRKDLTDSRGEYAEYRAVRDKEMGELKSEHTACLIEQERLRAANDRLDGRLSELEAAVKQLRGGSGG